MKNERRKYDSNKRMIDKYIKKHKKLKTKYVIMTKDSMIGNYRDGEVCEISSKFLWNKLFIGMFMGKFKIMLPSRYWLLFEDGEYTGSVVYRKSFKRKS